MTARFIFAVVLTVYTSLASSAERCPPTNLNLDWSAECFETKGGTRKVKQDFIKNLKLNQYGMTTVLIAVPRELVAVNRKGKVVVPGIRHTGDFDYPNAHAGIGRFYSNGGTGASRTQCGYFTSERFGIIVPARFDHCEPFKVSQALACTNCVSYCTESDCQDSVLVGGQGTIIEKDGVTQKTFSLPSLETVCLKPELVRISKLSTGADMLRCVNGSGDPFNAP